MVHSPVSHCNRYNLGWSLFVHAHLLQPIALFVDAAAELPNTSRTKRGLGALVRVFGKTTPSDQWLTFPARACPQGPCTRVRQTRRPTQVVVVLPSGIIQVNDTHVHCTQAPDSKTSSTHTSTIHARHIVILKQTLGGAFEPRVQTHTLPPLRSS